MKLIPDFLRRKTPREKALLANEGGWRGPFFGLSEFNNPFLIENYSDGWQRNLKVDSNEARRVSAVYACVMITARAIEQCTPLHLVENEKGELKPSKTSPASRLFRIPNSYETWAQIILNSVAEMLFSGECIWLVVRDDRYVITQAHRIPRGSWQIHIDPESREIFYGISHSENDLVYTPDILVPARDICHFRQYCPTHPLIGQSPISAAAMAIGLNVSLSRSQLAFFSQANRPSGVMSTDLPLTADQMKQLRAAFDEQSKDWKAGGVPILGNGLKFQPMSLTANDSQLIEQQKMSVAEIARVFGVPMALISDTSGPQGGTEAMISHWLSIGLGSVIETIERSLERLFNMPLGQQVELDPGPLVRVEFNKQIEGLTKSIQGGLMSINEARAKRNLPPVEYGDVPALQQQMVPIDLLHDLHVSTLANSMKPEEPAEEPQEPEDTEEPQDTEEPAEEPQEPEQEPLDKGYFEYLLRNFINEAAL